MTSLLSLARIRLASTPTPLQKANGLSHALGAEIWFKRDDLTGLGLGGNKVRALEYLLAQAAQMGCDCLVTGAGPQSNWAMLAAAAGRYLSMDTHLVFYGSPRPATGNHRLAELIGATVTYTGDPDRASVDAAIEATAKRLRARRRHPYVLPRGGATPLGAVGYVRASLELAEQLVAMELAPAQLWLATGSCATQAGLVAGARWLNLPYAVVGVSVSRPAGEAVERVRELAAGASALIGGPEPRHGDIRVLGGFLGPGYGQRSAEGEEAAELVARTQGLFLDPVFGAKAMAALMADLMGTDQTDDPVVFLVSGGAPTLFSV